MTIRHREHYYIVLVSVAGRQNPALRPRFPQIGLIPRRACTLLPASKSKRVNGLSFLLDLLKLELLLSPTVS